MIEREHFKEIRRTDGQPDGQIDCGDERTAGDGLVNVREGAEQELATVHARVSIKRRVDVVEVIPAPVAAGAPSNRHGVARVVEHQGLRRCIRHGVLPCPR